MLKAQEILDSKKRLGVIDSMTFPNTFNALVAGKDLNEDRKVIVVFEEDMMNAAQEFPEELKIIEKAPDCPACGTKTTRGILPDYRGQECLSKYPSCGMCRGFADEEFYEIFRADKENKRKIIGEIEKKYESADY